MNTPDDPLRLLALQHLQTFCTRILPGTIRRIAVWKQLRSAQLPDLLDDLHQELAVDCLENPELVVQLPASERNGRWMRMAERWIYHHFLRGRVVEEVHEQLPAPAGAPRLGGDRSHLLGLGVQFGNGRWNMAASAARSGRRRANLQRELDRLVAHLGYDSEYDAFWRTRLAEAMTGLAADLLRERAPLHMLPRPRRAPDPRGRLRRIRTIGVRFHIRPSTIMVRRMLRPWLRRPRLDGEAPYQLLQNAIVLAPQAVAGWLWLFEACLERRDLRGAAAAIRASRCCTDRPRGAIVLARARLLEARLRWSAASALLARAAARWPADARLRLARVFLSA